MDDDESTSKAKGLSDIISVEYYEELKESLVKTLKQIADKDNKLKLQEMFNDAVKELVEGFKQLGNNFQLGAKELKEDADDVLVELFANFLTAVCKIESIMDSHIEHMKNEFDKAENKMFKTADDVQKWWDEETELFGNYMEKVFDAVGDIVLKNGGDPKDYKRVAFIPTTYKLKADPADPTTSVIVIRGLAKVAEWGIKATMTIINPLSAIYIMGTEDVDTRILFYKNHPPLVNPWQVEDDKPAYKKEKPLEFPVSLPMNTIIPITLCRGLPTKVFMPFIDDNRDNKITKVAVQFLFADKLYQDSNWIWLFLDELDGKENDIKRYGFGWYLQGRFFEDHSFYFSLENRYFIDTVSMDFKQKDSKGYKFPDFKLWEPNSTRNLFTHFEIDNKEFDVTCEARSNEAGIVGRRVRVEASVSAEIQEIVGGKIALGVKSELPTTLTQTITDIGDEMIKNEVIQSVLPMVEELKNACDNFVDYFKAHCNKEGCDGTGERIESVIKDGLELRNYRCMKCKKTFNSLEDDEWDQLVSGVSGVGNLGAALAHYACVSFKTAWSMLKVIMQKIPDEKSKVVIEFVISGELGASAGGAELAELSLGIKLFRLYGPVSLIRGNLRNLAELAGKIFIHVALLVYEDFKDAWESDNVFREVVKKLSELAFIPGVFAGYYAKAIPLALKNMDKAWVKKVYKDVFIGIGVDFGAKIMPTFFGKLGVSVQPVRVRLDCNLGAFCEDYKGKGDNIYKLSDGNSLSVKVGGSIPYVAGKADADVGMSFPLKVAKVRVKTKESLFYS